MTFPADDYTPHGYLDTPTHTRNLSPRGVLRSHGAGFRWHFPAYAGSYGGRRETYRAGFRVAIDGALALADYTSVSSPYHSKDLFALDLARGAAAARVWFQLVGEHVLHATVDAPQAGRVAICAEYTRLLAANGEWGESGLVGRIEDGLLVLQGFEDGDAFVLWASQPRLDVGVTTDPADVAGWAAGGAPGLPADGFVAAIGARGAQVALHAVLGFAPAGPIEIMLARGKTAAEARRALAEARRLAGSEHARKQAADAAFWERAPRLEGDWPEHWRRGLVYDFETLRMMVKHPIGIYRHAWDAMQIQAPRVVLAETAIDALLLSYADARLAQDLMLGLLLDAPEPQVPCSREDGSYNMVAADGSVCGTAPPWGYPWLVLAWLAALRPDSAWLAQIYPRLAAYLDWWLEQRRDNEGWLFYACSWESGQDDSPRFGAQPLGGGHPTRAVRPADLQAAFAHACSVMAGFAGELGLAADQHRWANLAAEFTSCTRQLWNGAHFADFDTRLGRLTDVDDVMLLAPLALGVADQPQATALGGALEAIDPAALTWPVGTWTAVEAAQAAGRHDIAAMLAAAVVDRAYRFWDAREAQPGRTLPGISCEYWPPSGRCGGEGYGWGAFTLHLLLHSLVGLAPAPDALVVRPNLPPAWRSAGRSYSVRLYWRERALELTLAPIDPDRVRLTVNRQARELAWGTRVRLAWEELQSAVGSRQ